MKRFLKVFLIVGLLLANCFAGMILYKQYVISPKTDSIKWNYTLLDDVTELKDNKIKSINFDAAGNISEIILKKNMDLEKGDKLFVSYAGEPFICAVSEYDSSQMIIYAEEVNLEEIYEEFDFTIKHGSSYFSNSEVQHAEDAYIKKNTIRIACANTEMPLLLAATNKYELPMDFYSNMTGGIENFTPGFKNIGRESFRCYVGPDGKQKIDYYPSGSGKTHILETENVHFDMIEYLDSVYGTSFASYFENGTMEGDIDIIQRRKESVTGSYSADKGLSITYDSGQALDFNDVKVKGTFSLGIPLAAFHKGFMEELPGAGTQTYVNAGGSIAVPVDMDITIDGIMPPIKVVVDNQGARSLVNIGSVKVTGADNTRINGVSYIQNVSVIATGEDVVNKDIEIPLWQDDDKWSLWEFFRELFGKETNTDYSMYEPTLSEYYQLLSEFQNGDENAFYGFSDVGSTANFEQSIIDYGNLSYTLYDIDKNGIKELIVGAWDDSSSRFGDILHIYSAESGEVQFIGIPSKVWYDKKNDSFDGLEVIYAVEISKKGYICYASTLIDEGYRNVGGNRWILNIPLDELSKYQGKTTSDIFKAKNVSPNEIVSFRDNNIHNISQFDGEVLE